MPKLILAWPIIWLMSTLAFRKEKNRYRTIEEGNAKLVQSMNSIPLLLGRTIIVSARKPK